ncbi:MAG TPA: TetR/AcrR family transcriptional regulator [Terriglobales bacterium]|jgi:AcrR family transcriptional regulator|nr:TetR/AcrR family transcriptional regulator [Terriglobales bacterium]
MARPANPRIREWLRNQAVDYVLSHGVGDLALRPLAKALKTNARMLVYHFGSREGLMREILAGVREREDERIQAWFQAGRKPRTLSEFLSWLWRWMSAPRTRPAARLLFELYALALRNPRDYPGVLEAPLAYWQKLTKKAGLRSEFEAAEATLLLAATRGLLLDLCATGDRARVGRAMQLLAQFVESRYAQGPGGTAKRKANR